MLTSVRFIVASAFGLAAALLAESGVASPRVRLDLRGSLDGSYLTSGPSLSLSQDAALSGTTSGRTGSFGFMGAGGDVGLAIGPHWTIALLGLHGYGAVGSYPSRLGSIEGTLVQVEPWTASLWEVDVGGFGLRTTVRRWAFELGVTTGFALMVVKLAQVQGATAQELDTAATGLSPLVKAGLSVCRRLDPSQRVCLGVAPNIYEFGFMNGGSLSLRWELGS